MAGPKVTAKSIVQIPTPKMVAEYQAVSPERCSQMLGMVQKELDRNNRYAFAGMALAFLAFLILIGCAAWMAYGSELSGDVGFYFSDRDRAGQRLPQREALVLRAPGSPGPGSESFTPS
jgi:hypothetical protein